MKRILSLFLIILIGFILFPAIGHSIKIDAQTAVTATVIDQTKSNQLNKGPKKAINVSVATENCAYVRSFGAKGDGKTDDTAALNSALASMSSSKGTVYLTAGDYAIYNTIFIPKGVSLKGLGGKISRKFNWHKSHTGVVLSGDNIIDGIKWDGGSKIIPVDRASYECNQYNDFSLLTANDATGIGKNYTFVNNSFFNSCGSFIVGPSRNVIISNNYFGEYKDHCCYFANLVHGSNYTGNITITGNVFEALSVDSYRDAIKTRGGIERLAITGNTANIPYGIFTALTVDAKASSANSVKHVVITGNSVTCDMFLNANNVGNVPYFLEDVVINGNSINYKPGSTRDIISVGSYSGGVEAGNVLISGNQIKAYRMSFVGKANAIGINRVVLSDNDIELEKPILYGGNIKELIIQDNKAFTNVDSNPFMESSYLLERPTIAGNVIIQNNILTGKYYAIVANRRDNYPKTNFLHNIYLIANTMISTATKQPHYLLYFTGTDNDINVLIYKRDNYINDEAATYGTLSKNKVTDGNLAKDKILQFNWRFNR